MKQDRRNSYHLICVDDDHEFLLSMRMALSTGLAVESSLFELELHFVNHPDECFTLIHELLKAQEKVALIISDQKMPKLTGIEFLELAKGLVPRAINILLTGYASLDSAKYAINHQLLDQYISKPIEDYDSFKAIINNALKTFHFREEKELAEQKAREHLQGLEKANEKIRDMQQAAEKIAYLSQGFRKLDLNEVLDLIITKIPLIFNSQNASLFLFDNQNNILRLVRTNFLEEDIQRPLNLGDGTPMSVALRENRIIVVPCVRKAPYKFLHKKSLGASCIIIPFIINRDDTAAPGKIEGMLKGLKGIRGVLNLSNIKHLENEDIIKYKATLVKDIMGINILNAQLYQQTQKLAIIDSLTGLYNKYIFLEFLKKECEMGKRQGGSFFLVISDIDDFKAINDTYGHRIGDEVLNQLGVLIRVHTRESDIIARFGGEEFAYIIREAEQDKVVLLLERVRHKIAAKKFVNSVELTMSFGVSRYYLERGDSWQKVIDRADTALYQAKAKGKNRVEIFNQGGEQDGDQPAE